MTLGEVLMRYLKDSPSVDQASLPSQESMWSVEHPVSIVLNLALAPRPSKMGTFSLILALDHYLEASEDQRPAIVEDIKVLLEGGARLKDYLNRISSWELEQLFASYHS